MSRFFRCALAVVAMLAAAACGDDPVQVQERAVAAVRLSRTQEALVVGQALQLSAVALDAKGAVIGGRPVQWRSENTGVATVSAAGLVTALAAGSTGIVAASEGREARATIVVTTPPPAAVDRVELSAATLVLTTGQTQAIAATPRDAHGNALQGRAVTWTTGDANVATVSATGVVTAAGPGSTQVTATSEGRQASAQVTVSAPVGTVASVTVNALMLSLQEGADYQLVATPRDAQGQPIPGLGMTWTSSDAGIAHVDASGLVTGIRAGNATITVRVHGREAHVATTVASGFPFALVYASHDDPAAGRSTLQRLDINAPAAAPGLIGQAGDRASTPRGSPDGEKIAFAGTIDGVPGIYVVERSGAGLRRVVGWPRGTVSDPTWSPDGTKLAYTLEQTTGASDIWVVNADGTGPVNLTADVPGLNQRMPAWSPALAGGSSRIAYVQRSAGGSSIWTMRPDGSDKRQVTTGESDMQPAWSPDGSTIVFQRSAAGIFGDLWLVHAAGGGERALMSAHTLAGPQWAPAWSPDGRLIAFTSSHETYGSGSAVQQVYTVWADGSKLARRTGPDGVAKSSPTWIAR